MTARWWKGAAATAVGVLMLSVGSLHSQQQGSVDPFASIGGGVQLPNGDWVPKGHPLAQGGQTDPTQPPSSVDPFAAIGGGVQLPNGAWVPKGHPLAAAAEPGEEETGNNLSVPVIWSDGVTKVLRGTYGAPVFGGEFFQIDGVKYYLQQDPLNTWQAQSVSGVGAPVDVSWVDWGDNLEARSWYETSVVRIETVLLKDLATPMLGFVMEYLWGEGQTEMWGASTATYSATQATVYSGAARLTIQKLQKPPADAVLVWDPLTGQWMGEVNAPVFNHGVWEGGTGKPSDRYSGEINISGKVVYGYNWNVRRTGEGAGYYRITLSLAPNAPNVPLNTFFMTTQLVPTAEEGEEVVAAAEPVGGVAGIDHANNLTYIDIEILPGTGRTGGSGGSGGPGGPGGS